jgi:hypothetical protein
MLTPLATSKLLAEANENSAAVRSWLDTERGLRRRFTHVF